MKQTIWSFTCKGYVALCEKRNKFKDVLGHFQCQLTLRAKNYLSEKKQYEKEKKKMSGREIRIAIISAIVGAAIGLLPFVYQLVQTNNQ